MKFYGNVAGVIHTAQQQAYEKPIDGTRTCSRCGAKFIANRNRRYCSDECRKLAYMEKHRENSRRYNARKRREKIGA